MKLYLPNRQALVKANFCLSGFATERHPGPFIGNPFLLTKPARVL